MCARTDGCDDPKGQYRMSVEGEALVIEIRSDTAPRMVGRNRMARIIVIDEMC
jgi:hypothetical protein